MLEIDPYNSNALLVHISCLVQLNKKNQLFSLAHELVDLFPTKSISWFAVGTYYLSVEKFQEARRYYR